MRTIDWLFLGAWAFAFGAAMLLAYWPRRPEKPKVTTITVDMDQLMPGEVWKATSERYDLAILAYEDLEAMCARGGYALRDRTERKAIWEPTPPKTGDKS